MLQKNRAAAASAHQKNAPLRDQAQRGADCANSQERTQLRVLAMVSQALAGCADRDHSLGELFLMLIALALTLRWGQWLILRALNKHDDNNRS